MKNKYLIAACLILSLMITMNAQEIIQLPNTDPGDLKWENPEKEYFSEVWQTEVVTNVSNPTMTVYKPEGEYNSGTAVVICPGGGLYGLSINSEGRDVAKWLAKKGVTSFVLKYRLVPTGDDGTQDIMNDGAQVEIKAKNVLPLATTDGLNAIAYARNNAEKYGIDKDKIGIMGFSAGGAVTMSVTYAAEEKNKPNFIGPVYAWMNVVGEHPVPAEAPLMFVVCATDDPLGLAPASVELYQVWTAAGQMAELHMYSKGGHGFGMRVQNLPSDKWIERFGDWLQVQALMK